MESNQPEVPIFDLYAQFQMNSRTKLTKAQHILFICMALLSNEKSLGNGWYHESPEAKNAIFKEILASVLTPEILSGDPSTILFWIETALKAKHCFLYSKRQGTINGPKDQELFEKIAEILAKEEEPITQ